MSTNIMSCKCLYYFHLIDICIMSACISPQCKTWGGSVSRFKFQKHESSFKHASFKGLIGCGIAQSSACTACFPKMQKNQQRFHWHPTKWHRQYSSCCYGYSSHPCVLITVSYRNCSLTCLKLPNYVTRTYSVFATWAKATQKDIFETIHEFQIKGAEDHKG